MKLNITVYGDTQFNRKIRDVGRRAERARPLYTAIGFRLQEIQREQFHSQGARGSGGWEPLKESTIRAKGHAIIFFDTGELMGSFIAGDPLNLFIADDDQLLWGSLSSHGQWHQPDPQGRKVFELTDADRNELVRDMHYWVIFGSLPNEMGRQSIRL